MDQLRNGTPNLSTSTSTTCSVRNLIEAVAKIRHQKQCATVVRIHKAVRQQLQRNIDVEEVIQQLALATNSGALWRVDNNGVTSYREPPKGSSKEQVRWSQKDSTRWPNKEAQVRSANSNHAKYPLPDHVPYAVPDNNMFQQMADQFSWSEARRWTESVTPWNMEPVRQHLGDSITWPMNETLKRPTNDPISWTSSDQYRIVQESFPWPMPADSFAWPVTEPWRQTMIEQFKRAEGSQTMMEQFKRAEGNFVFENMNYRSLVDSTQKNNLMNEQWPASDDSSKKCSLPKETFHSPRDQLSSMNGSQNSNIVPENMHSLDKQHKSNLGVCQAFPDVKSVPQVECTTNWYNKGIPSDQIMNFPVQERKEFNNSCTSPNNYLTPAYASENANSLQNSTSSQHISSHFYETNEGPPANESFSNGIQAADNSYGGHAYMENNSMYCSDDGTYKPVDQESASKPQYHNQYEAVTWSNYPESEEMQPSKMCFTDKLEQENFIDDENSKTNRVGETCETQKTASKSENVSRNEFISPDAGGTMVRDDDDDDDNDDDGSSDSNSQILHDKPPNLTTFSNNERKERNVLEEEGSPPVLDDPSAEMQVVTSGGGNENTKSKESSEENWVSSDCRKSCEDEVCHHMKESLADSNDPTLLSNKLKSREAPLPILEKLTPQSLKSELNMTISEEKSVGDEKKFEGVTLEMKLQSCKNESAGQKRKMNIFDTLVPYAKCSKMSEDRTMWSCKDVDEESKKTSVKLPATTSLQPPTDIHLRGLVDGLTRFFTPSNKRPSRVSQNAIQRNASLVQACLTPTRLRKPPTSPSFVKVKKLFSKPPIGRSVTTSSSSSLTNGGLLSLATRKPRREQLIDGLSHFFSAQGKRKTRFNKTMYNDNVSTVRSQSSSSRDDSILEETPRLRASSANASSASSLIPLGNSVRWSSENLGCKESNFHVNPLMVSRLKSTKWLSNTRKQPESLMLKLNSPAASVAFSSTGELSAAMSPDSSPNEINSHLNAKSEEKTSKSGESSKVEEHPRSPSKIYPLKPTSEDTSMFRKARENFLKKFNSESSYSSVNLSSIQFGEFKIEVSYLSNFPNEFSSLPVLYFCEFCLKYFKSSLPLQKHLNTCMCRRPPGNEVYRTSGGFSIFEVEACSNTMYCEHLCSMSRLFVEPELQMLFSSSSHLFYILTKNDHQGSHLIGYFVRDRSQGKGPCLTFLCVLPPHRRKGYASLLINFSYQLCNLLNVPGSLKRIFSVPILSAFQQYWSWSVLDYFQHSWNHKQPLAVKDLSKSLGIASTNITSTLLKLGIIQTKSKSKSTFNPNVRAIESHAKELMRKEKSFIRINFKNICIESSLLLKDKLTVDRVNLLNISRGVSDDDEEYHLDNDDSGISLHCGSCGESQQELIVSEGIPIPTEHQPAVDSMPQNSNNLVTSQRSDNLVTSQRSENPTSLEAASDDKTSSKSSAPLIGMVKKESRSVEVQTDAYESEYSSDEYDDDDDDDDEGEDDDNDVGPADGGVISQHVSKDKNPSASQKVHVNEKLNSTDGLKMVNDDAMSQDSFSNKTEKNLPHDPNNNTNKKIQDESYSDNSKTTENQTSSEQLSRADLLEKGLEKNASNLVQGVVNDPGCKNNSNKKTYQQVKEHSLPRNTHIESYSYQLPSPANSDMRSPSSVSSYPMSNQPASKEFASEKTLTTDQNASPSGTNYLDKMTIHQPTNKFTNECYLPSDAANVPTSSSPSVYTGLYFNNPLNPLFINQNSPGSVNCNHYNMPTPSPTNSSSRSFGMASPNSNNFQTPQNNPQLIDRGCPSAPMLTYGRVACPQPSNEGQFPWTPIYHSQPPPAGYSFIKFSDQEILPCGIAPFPSMTPLPDSFTNAIALAPPSKCLPSTSQPSKITNRKCGSKTCKASASITQCNSFRSQSVAPNVTIQPGTNVITNYNVLNMNVTPEYRHHQPITYPSPPYIAATNPAFIGQTAKQHINIYQHQAIGFPQQPQHHNGMYAAATYNYLNGAIAPQSFSINVNNIMK